MVNNRLYIFPMGSYPRSFIFKIKGYVLELNVFHKYVLAYRMIGIILAKLNFLKGTVSKGANETKFGKKQKLIAILRNWNIPRK